MGDSAGGTLLLLTVQSIIADDLARPSSLVLFSPWTDLSMSGRTYSTNNDRDPLLSENHVQWLIEHLIDPTLDKSILSTSNYSPLFGSFRSFPPVYLTVGTNEILEDDSRQLHRRLVENKVNVSFEIGLDLMHVYPLFFHYFPEAQQSLENIGLWIDGIDNR